MTQFAAAMVSGRSTYAATVLLTASAVDAAAAPTSFHTATDAAAFPFPHHDADAATPELKDVHPATGTTAREAYEAEIRSWNKLFAPLWEY